MSGSWPTPQEADGERGTEYVRRKEGNPTLLGATRSENWPTPTEGDSKASGSRIGNPDTKAHPGVSLTDATARNWQTPTTEDCEQTGSAGDRGPTLTSQAREDLWPTPSATPYGTSNNGDPHDGRGQYAMKGKPSLEGMAREDWSTPTARDRESPAKVTRGAGAMPGGRPLVQVEAANWATPRESEHKGTGPKGSKSQKYRLAKGYLDAQVEELGPPAPASHSIRGKSRGSLNSRWVAQLMGFPSDWCALSIEDLSKLSATRSSRRLLK